ncbi:hypothetical protein MMC28_004212 [Mycoblastus sanguinarius]|nr:hypothetical protein [Mycoblastus sanguinarius]
MDEQRRDLFVSSRYSKWPPKSPSLQIAPNIPFSGGYPDFIKHPDFGCNVPKGPPRTSALEDMCFYLVEYGNHTVGNSGPHIAAVIMQKVVASNYMQLVDFVRANITSLEYQLSRRDILTGTQISWIDEQWRDLQTWSRQCSEYVEDVEAIMISLGISFPASFAPQHKATNLARCNEDFQYIHYRLKALKARVEVLNNSMTGLASISGSRQALFEAKRSLKEAKNIKTLTLLGMVFAPLAFCTGLFSMNEQYLPGTGLFWIYFAVAIPLILAVFTFAFLVRLGYNDEGDWNLQTLFQNLSTLK